MPHPLPHPSAHGRPPSAATLRWIEECLGTGSRVKLVRPLVGGAAHVNHALLVESRAGTAHRLVLRRWARRGWNLTDLEFSPEREIAALALLAGCGIATPSLVAADPSGAYCDAPTLLISRLPGHAPRPAVGDLPEYLIQLAAALLSVHALEGAPTMPPYTPYNRLILQSPPRHATRPGLWEQAFEIVSGSPPEAAPHFIHRDYEPDNTLWSSGRLTGIVDWDRASYGPIAVDVAHMRCKLALRYGIAAADRFLADVDQVRGGYEHDPYWDLRCVIDLLPGGRSPIDETGVPLLEGYLEALLAQFGVPVHH
ncbi:aminoglycoside phosphotransferase family protein [Actinomadura sp. HBU206391]|uniref:phosphotransferase family protein n=1 Tax=Actinomadura sp. HBU206391 TaxID=2731692 RepID=UPI0029058523|nr:aminoglycoside phosphotransferase family protein [Actinomadura sp. HBU206391]